MGPAEKPCTVKRWEARPPYWRGPHGGGHLGGGAAVGAAILEVKPAPPQELELSSSPLPGYLLSSTSLGNAFLSLPGSVCFLFHLSSARSCVRVEVLSLASECLLVTILPLETLSLSRHPL